MSSRLLYGLGFCSLLPYLAAWWLGDLRKATLPFLLIFALAFAIYALATVLILRQPTLTRRDLVVIFSVAALSMAILCLTRPTLSDDMYRYVWEGRLQGQGISPYWRPPDAPELTALRDDVIWPLVNRKGAITVYPPAAELSYALLWRIWPDSYTWFQIAMALGALLAGGLLVGLLRDLGKSPARALIYLWSPLLIFETAHGAHVDGLMLPLLVAAFWARVRQRDTLLGVLLGLATAMKFYPAMLAPALWRPQHPQGRWRMPLAMSTTIAACYAPYVWRDGWGVLGFLPNYFGERFNMGLASWLIPFFQQLGLEPNQSLLRLTLLLLGGCSLYFVARPAPDAETALRRCLWLIGCFTLLTQNLFSWYMLWLLPLIAIFVQAAPLSGLRLDAWTGWWLFCGLVMLSYTFFIRWRPVPLALAVEFISLYLLLLVDLIRRSTLQVRHFAQRESV